MSALMVAYVPHAFVADALRVGWCGVSDRALTHHCFYSQVMWRCDCERRHIMPAGMRRGSVTRYDLEGTDVPADAGCWGGSAP